MAEESGAVTGAPQGGGTGAAPGAGVGAGVGAGTTTAPVAGQGGPWYSTFDAEFQGYMQNKGHDKLPDPTAAYLAAAKSNRELERTLGSNKIALPKDDGDKDGWNKFYEAGGRPKVWNDYGIKVPEGGNQEFADYMAQTFHEAGLSKKQALAIVAKSDERGKATALAREQQRSTQSAADFKTVQQEWGAMSDHKFAAGQRAMQAYGIDKPTSEKLERAIGTKQFLTMMSEIGASISEDRSAGGGGGNGGNPSPEAAQARLNDLSKDADWTAKFAKQDSVAVAEYKRLTNIIAAARSA